ncbi:GntR family transcriptional regulator [Microbacterium caowuchunii]|uniref:GntR family transcriptional regulator n=1 Tax=Microbacterium caowuchunii TaxID=2614638 RepID=A0A5N0TBD0_9MICO|nr:GntR family transcriptional regulator [Microbacterium caowuchunii]KAA9132393.1 GntR family transcriptional regulator [Microbacterium caowuchunii]
MGDSKSDGGSPIHRDLPVAIHSQISDGFRARIASGEWPAHYRLKSEPDLAAELGVSRGTLRRALTTLIDEGLLRQVRGRGTFVTSTMIEPAIAQKLSTLSEDFSSQGIETTTRVISCELIDPPRPVAALLEVPAGGSVMKLVRLRSTEQGPVAFLFNYVRTDFAPGIEDVDFASTSLFGTLEGRYGLRISSARRTFSAQAAEGEVAAQLDIPEGAPVQYLEQVTYLANGRPIEYSDVWIHSGRLRVTSMLSRR